MGLTKKWGSGIVKNCQDAYIGDAEPFGHMVFRILGGGFLCHSAVGDVPN